MRFHDLRLRRNARLTIGRLMWSVALYLWLSTSAAAHSDKIVVPPLLEKPAGAALRVPGAFSRASFAHSAVAASARQRVVIHRVVGPLPWRVTDIRMLAPGVGWAQTAHGLMWTENNGKEWREIELPSKPITGGGSVVSFLDPHRGWALLVDQDERRPRLYLSSTIDSGNTWSSYFRVNLPEQLPNRYGLPIYWCGARFAFVDSLHGWMDLTLGTETVNTWWSYLLVTSDGGHNWNVVPSAPELAGPAILLVTPSEGWLLGSSQENPYRELHVTRDGGRSWQRVSVPSVGGALAKAYVDYDLPKFSDERHGYLQVSYLHYDASDHVSESLFATDDGGRSWKLDRLAKNTSDQGQPSSSVVVDSSWILVGVSDHVPKATEVHQGETIDASAQAIPAKNSHGVDAISFASASQGWVVVGDGQLLSTTDGGQTWADITPGLRLGIF